MASKVTNGHTFAPTGFVHVNGVDLLHMGLQQHRRQPAHGLDPSRSNHSTTVFLGPSADLHGRDVVVDRGWARRYHCRAGESLSETDNSLVSPASAARPRAVLNVSDH